MQNDSTMKEKAEVLENEKRLLREQQGATFSGFAQAEAETPLGRFTANERSTVIGATPNPATAYPTGPAWCAGDQGLEPSVGYAINDAPVVGEAHEIAASIAAQDAPSPSESSLAAQGVSGDPAAAPSHRLASKRAGSPPFRRRPK